MITTVKNLKEFKAQSEAYNIFYKEYLEEEYDNDDFEYMIEFIRDCYDTDNEKVDSNYITQIFSKTIGKYKFSITEESYRKDQSICDPDPATEIDITDIEAELLDKANKKLAKVSENLNKWKSFINKSTQEELLEVLKNINFPKIK